MAKWKQGYFKSYRRRVNCALAATVAGAVLTTCAAIGKEVAGPELAFCAFVGGAIGWAAAALANGKRG